MRGVTNIGFYVLYKGHEYKQVNFQAQSEQVDLSPDSLRLTGNLISAYLVRRMNTISGQLFNSRIDVFDGVVACMEIIDDKGNLNEYQFAPAPQCVEVSSLAMNALLINGANHAYTTKRIMDKFMGNPTFTINSDIASRMAFVSMIAKDVANDELELSALVEAIHKG